MFWSEGLIRKWNTYICIFLPRFFKWKEKVLDWDILRGARVNKLTVWTIDTHVCECVLFFCTWETETLGVLLYQTLPAVSESLRDLVH